MKRLMSILPLLPLLLGFSSSAAAQNQPTEFILIVTVTVKPEAVSEYEGYVKKTQAAANKIGTPQRMLVYQLADTYNFVLPFNKGDEADVAWLTNQSELLRKAYGDAEARHIEESSFQCIRKREFRILTYRPDLSQPAAGAAPSSK